MRLLKNLIEKKLEYYSEYEINQRYIESVWVFYSAYFMCINILGYEDKFILSKMSKIKKLLLSGFNHENYSKILKQIKIDMKVIERTMMYIENLQEAEETFGDYYVAGALGVSIHD